jgi:hypothetical protein
MRKDKNEKFATIKQKIKTHAPMIIACTAYAGVVSFIVFNATKALKPVSGESDWTLPTITGDEKAEILGREDSVLQRIEDDAYFLLFPTTDTQTED